MGVRLLRTAQAFEFFDASALPRLHISAARKCLACPHQIRNSSSFVLVKATQLARQIPHEVGVEGVELVGPVQRYRRDRFLEAIFDQVETSPDLRDSSFYG